MRSTAIHLNSADHKRGRCRGPAGNTDKKLQTWYRGSRRDRPKQPQSTRRPSKSTVRATTYVNSHVILALAQVFNFPGDAGIVRRGAAGDRPGVHGLRALT